MTDHPEPMWQPSLSQIEQSRITEFIEMIRGDGEFGADRVTNYDSLYHWSVDSSEQFWSAFWRFCGVKSTQDWDTILENPDAMPGARWFPGARLNYAENCLRHRDDRVAILACTEASGDEPSPAKEITYEELYHQVAVCQFHKFSLSLSQWHGY